MALLLTVVLSAQMNTPTDIQLSVYVSECCQLQRDNDSDTKTIY